MCVIFVACLLVGAATDAVIEVSVADPEVIFTLGFCACAYILHLLLHFPHRVSELRKLRHYHRVG